MTDKVTFSDFVCKNFEKALYKLSKKKRKADDIYHKDYVSVNAYIDKYNDSILKSMCYKIANQQYRCAPLTPIILPKSSYLKNTLLTMDNTRLVCVPSVQDKLLQKLFIKYLRIYYEDTYNSFCKYDHALNKGINKKEVEYSDKEGNIHKKNIDGIRKALDDVIEYRNQHKYVIKADIVKFFDNIDREQALKKFSTVFSKIENNDELISIFASFIYCDANLAYGDWKYIKLIESHLQILEGKGVRQGMPIASLCSSMYLSDFDNLITRKNIPYIRYADDFLLFSDSYIGAKAIKDLVISSLDAIKLKIEKSTGEQKTQIYGFKKDFTYLGFDIVYFYKEDVYKIRIPSSVFDKAIERINSFQSMTKVKRECGSYVDFSIYLKVLISGYTNFYSEDLAINGVHFKNQLLQASKDVRKKLITDNLNINFEDIGSANKRMFFFGIK
ncbi:MULTISPECIES: reverse transcriptase domain-containing protein [unclassified Psychrobacter]|uniref:reverse transcriptase domain-containing protein n=1 Tax=unclassified Psychrobacter TaxID=196806 RepID=UPI0018F43E86|nr:MULTISPECIES: reverse transcriptase domain-containing protein [unclassified Psychrobacter]